MMNRPELPNWDVIKQDGIERLQRVFKFQNFVEALQFTNRVGELAEAHQHHPLIVTEWGRVTVQWWTHTAGGIDKNDLLLAAKTDELMAQKE